MKIDLHVHSSDLSACARSSAESMIRAGAEFGLDALCFMEHNKLWPVEAVEYLNRLYAPFRVYAGIEVSITALDHCMVLGLRDRELQERPWTYPELHGFVRERGGWLAVCHPFRFDEEIPFEIDEFPPDAIELHSVNIAACDEGRIRETARRVGARLVCNSDAHFAQHVGVYYNELKGSLPQRSQRAQSPGSPAESGGAEPSVSSVSSVAGRAVPPADERALAEILKAGDYERRADGPRLAEVNSEIDEREELVKKMIAEGRDGAYFEKKTGLPAHYFDRVAAGRSDRI